MANDAGSIELPAVTTLPPSLDVQIHPSCSAFSPLQSSDYFPLLVNIPFKSCKLLWVINVIYLTTLAKAKIT
jgi:hypothetical protein